MCHGFGGSLENSKLLAEELEKQNISSFRFNYTDTQGEPVMHYDLQERIDNANYITDYFKDKYQNYVLVGASLGGLTSILTAHVNKKVNAVVLLNPFLYLWKKIAWNDRKFIYLQHLASFFNSSIRKNLDLYHKHFLPKELNQKVFIFCSKADKRVDYSHSTSFYNEIPNKGDLVVDDKADHGLTHQRDIEKVVVLMTKWLNNI